MPRPKGITDDEYLDLLKKGLSPSDICRSLGLSYGSSVKARLERIGTENGISWKTLRTGFDTEEKEKESKLFRIHDRERVVSLEIENGSIAVGTDPHWDRIEKVSVAHKAFCNVIADLGEQIKGVVLNGDLANMGAVSRFPRGPWRNPKPPTVREELEAVQQRSSEITSVAPKKAAKLRTLGNHDDRLEAKLSACSEALEGLPGTRLRDHIPEWTECERIDVNGHLECVHNIRGGEPGRDRQNVFATGHHTVVGHSHQLHVWPQTWRRGTFFGICAGTLADLDDEVFHYLGSRPANWQSGFVLLTWQDGILLYPECGAVLDGKCWFRGKRYA